MVGTVGNHGCPRGFQGRFQVKAVGETVRIEASRVFGMILMCRRNALADSNVAKMKSSLAVNGQNQAENRLLSSDDDVDFGDDPIDIDHVVHGQRIGSILRNDNLGLHRGHGREIEIVAQHKIR